MSESLASLEANPSVLATYRFSGDELVLEGNVCDKPGSYRMEVVEGADQPTVIRFRRANDTCQDRFDVLGKTTWERME